LQKALNFPQQKKPILGYLLTVEQRIFNICISRLYFSLHYLARKTINGLLQRETDFTLPDLWPHNIPDLNAVDYLVWGVIEQHAYQNKVNTVDELKERLIAVWSNF